jgi:DNA-binding GntR family transcriptional regulator
METAPGGRHREVAAPPTVGEKVYAKMRSAILLGERLPGTKLKLDPIRKELGVSASTLREALAQLATEGLVEAEGQKGFRVNPISRDDLREVSELRQLLECHAVRKSIEAGDLKWEQDIVAAHRMLVLSERLMMEGGTAYAAEWQKFDREFHIALMSACGSRWILRMYRQIHDQYLRYQALSFKTAGFRGKALISEHAALMDYALNRNADAATALLARHIQAGIDHSIGDALSATSSVL